MKWSKNIKQKKDNKKHPIILFLNHGLGELLMAIPFLRAAVQQLYEGTKFIVFLDTEKEKDVIELSGLSRFLDIRLFNRERIFRHLLELHQLSPSLVFVPHAIDGWHMPLLVKFTCPKISIGHAIPYPIIGFDFGIPRPPGIHKAEYYYNHLKPLSSFSLNAKMDIQLPIPESLKEHVFNMVPERRDASRWILLAPGSGQKESHKRWSDDKYSVLAQKLLQSFSDIRLMIIGSPQERWLLDTVYSRMRYYKDRCIIVTPDRVMHAIALMEGAACLVSGCCGATHMAAAVNVPIVGIFGPTNPGFTGPYTDKLYTLRVGLSCSPCYRRGFIQGCSKPICMEKITVDQVYEAVINVLEGKPFPPIPWIATTNATESAYT